MMPVIDGTGQPEHQIDYKQKYKALKKKLKFLVYEQECFLEELRRAQRRLLKVSRDRSFLLDRLLGYEKINESSEDSDATASSDTEGEGHKDGSGVRRKKGSSTTPAGLDPSPIHLGLGFAGLGQGHSLLGPPKKKQKIGIKKTNKPHDISPHDCWAWNPEVICTYMFADRRVDLNGNSQFGLGTAISPKKENPKRWYCQGPDDKRRIGKAPGLQEKQVWHREGTCQTSNGDI